VTGMVYPSWLDSCPEPEPGYEEYAAVYDAGFDDVVDDLDFWSSLANADSTICEMGCGTGRVTAHLAARGHVIGVDPSPAMLAKARQRLATTDLRRGGLCKIPARDGEFDAVLCIRGSFSHLISPADQATAGRELARVTKPGGLLVIDVPHHPQPDLMTSEVQFVKERDHDGVRHEFYVETTFDPHWRVWETQQYVLVHKDSDDREMHTFRLHTKALSITELTCLLISCNFDILHVWGNYDRVQFSADSPRLIVAARRQ
jgi:SAM-dependent methyltransferase